MERLSKKLITISILLVFSIECTGIDCLSSVICAKNNALRPVSTLVSGMQCEAVKDSSAGKSKTESDLPIEGNALSLKYKGRLLYALIFLLSIAGSFYISLVFTQDILVTFAVTTAVTVGELIYFEILPSFIRKRAATHRKRKQAIIAKKRQAHRKMTKEDKKAQRAEERRQLLTEANKILDEIFSKNNPTVFEDYPSFKKAVENAINSRLPEGHKKQRIIKSRIKKFLMKKYYFAEKKVEQGRRRRAEELRQERIGLAEKTRLLQEIENRLKTIMPEYLAGKGNLLKGVEAEEPIKIKKKLQERLAQEREKLAGFEEKLSQFKQKVDAESQRNKRLLIRCKGELSKVKPAMCKNKKEFLDRLARIRKKFRILPAIDDLIDEKANEWKSYEEMVVTVGRLEEVFVEELYKTEEKTDLQKTPAAIKMYNFILMLPPKMRRERFDRFYSELNKRYIQIADEQLRLLREGKFEGPIENSRPVKIINYICDWLIMQIQIHKYENLRPECRRINKELHEAEQGQKANSAGRTAAEDKLTGPMHKNAVPVFLNAREYVDVAISSAA